MREPLPTPSATGVRVAGDRYQWLVVWEACVDSLLDNIAGVDNPIVKVGVEMNGVGNLDDVVVNRKRPPHAYKQVKYAVDGRTPSNTAYLTEPSASGGPSILRKIAVAWRGLAQPGVPIELAIVTNRLADPMDSTIAARDSRTRLLLPKAALGGEGSALGKARATWAAATDLSRPELPELLSVLSFDLGLDPEHLSRSVRLSMAVAGLRSDEAAMEAAIDWIERQVIEGRRELGLDEIREMIEARNLKIGNDAARCPSRRLHPMPSPSTPVYDLSTGSIASTVSMLSKSVDRDHPRLGTSFRRTLNRFHLISGQPIEWSSRGACDRPSIHGRVRGQAGGGVEIEFVQRGELWCSDARYAAPITPVSTEIDIGQGDDLAVAVEIATSISDDVNAWIRRALFRSTASSLSDRSAARWDNAVTNADAAQCLGGWDTRQGFRSRNEVGYPRDSIALVPDGFRATAWSPVEPRRTNGRV